MAKFIYETTCVLAGQTENFGQAVKDLTLMTDEAVEVTLGTIRRHCDIEGFQRDMGYAIGPEDGLHLKDDWHVSYRRSRYRGRPCFYIVHSAIEHIFTELRQP